MERKEHLSNVPKKRFIDYTREYRHMPHPSVLNYAFAAYTSLPVVLLYVIFYSDITLALSKWAGRILASVTGQEVSVTSKAYFPGFGDIYFTDMQGRMPSFTYALAAALIAVVLIIIFSQGNYNSRPLMIYLCMGLYVFFISSLFFVFFPEHFPYTLTQYSELYMKQQVALWITISLLGGISIGLLCEKGIHKFIAFFTMAVMSFLYGCVRYVIYLYLLHAVSSILMATLFFTFGVLFDFLQLIAIFSIYIKGYSHRLSQRKRGANWLWS